MRALIAATLAILACSALAGAAEHKDKSGQYFCYLTGSAGVKLQENKPSYFGAIILSERKQRLFINIQKIQRYPSEIDHCKMSVSAYLDALENGKEYRDWDYNTVSPGKYPQQREWLGWTCFTKDELILKHPGDEGSQRFRSYDLQFRFYGLSTEEWIDFFEDNSFKRSEQFDTGTIVIEEGQCEKIVPPG